MADGAPANTQTPGMLTILKNEAAAGGLEVCDPDDTRHEALRV